MSGEALKEETPAPVTAAMDGRGSSGVNAQRYAVLLCEASPFYSAQEEALFAAISPRRFHPYVADGSDNAMGVARYALNIALSEALYPAIHCLEIALRNAIHKALCQSTGCSDWYDVSTDLNAYQRRIINDAKEKSREKLVKSGRSLDQVLPDDVIAELPLGFWTAFFNKRSKSTMSIQLLKPVFRYAPRKKLRLDDIGERTARFRTLRNRVFHHERIVHWVDLPSRHAEIMELISWISPELATICQRHDRFDSVHARGLTPWL